MELTRMIGRRVEIPVHYDLWMRGARFGVISSGGQREGAAFIRVKMDHPQVKRRVTIPRKDWEFVRVNL